MWVEDGRGHHRPDPLTRDPAETDRFAGDRDHAGIGPDEPDQDTQGRGLAGAVGTEKADDVALVDREVKAVERRHAPVSLAQAGRLDDEGHAAEAFGSGAPLSIRRCGRCGAGNGDWWPRWPPVSVSARPAAPAPAARPRRDRTRSTRSSGRSTSRTMDPCWHPGATASWRVRRCGRTAHIS